MPKQHLHSTAPAPEAGVRTVKVSPRQICRLIRRGALSATPRNDVSIRDASISTRPWEWE
jgi:hypothetical protein